VKYKYHTSTTSLTNSVYHTASGRAAFGTIVASCICNRQPRWGSSHHCHRKWRLCWMCRTASFVRTHDSTPKPAEQRACELKRLHILPLARGTGVGRARLLTIIGTANDRGYTHMHLDSLTPRPASAVKSYKSKGFVEVAAYYANGLAGAVFMCLDLRTP